MRAGQEPNLPLQAPLRPMMDGFILEEKMNHLFEEDELFCLLDLVVRISIRTSIIRHDHLMLLE